MFIKYLSLAVASLVTAMPSFGQSGSDMTSDAVLAPVHTLFDGMRAGDSTMVRGAFHPIARLVTTSYRDAKPDYRVTEIGDFVNLVGTPHDEVWDERIWDVRTEMKDNLASVWMKFSLYRGDTFSHCSVNSFELLNTEDGWKIMHIADTRRKADCEMPPEREM